DEDGYEGADEHAQAEAMTLAEVAHAAEEEALAREADDATPAMAEDREPELPFDLEPVRAEEAEEEPPLLLHSSWESAA
ncbi:MAG: hypothetical protein HKN05_18465, partial [Rhizobiales bacterium]|nr:hypothetical protein [Hyphomicrobiales bacterium]